MIPQIDLKRQHQALRRDPDLSWRSRLAGYEAKFIAFADEINGGMPRYVVELVRDALNEQTRAVKGSRILALGVAYKAGVGDVRDSPALEIIEALENLGAHVDYADPRVPQVTVGAHRLKAVAWADAERLVSEARLVVDTRNATGGLGEFRHVVRL